MKLRTNIVMYGMLLSAVGRIPAKPKIVMTPVATGAPMGADSTVKTPAIIITISQPAREIGLRPAATKERPPRLPREGPLLAG